MRLGTSDDLYRPSTPPRRALAFREPRAVAPQVSAASSGPGLFAESTVAAAATPPSCVGALSDASLWDGASGIAAAASSAGGGAGSRAAYGCSAGVSGNTSGTLGWALGALGSSPGSTAAADGAVGGSGLAGIGSPSGAGGPLGLGGLGAFAFGGGSSGSACCGSQATAAYAASSAQANAAADAAAVAAYGIQLRAWTDQQVDARLGQLLHALDLDGLRAGAVSTRAATERLEAELRSTARGVERLEAEVRALSATHGNHEARLRALGETSEQQPGLFDSALEQKLSECRVALREEFHEHLSAARPSQDVQENIVANVERVVERHLSLQRDTSAAEAEARATLEGRLEETARHFATKLEEAERQIEARLDKNRLELTQALSEARARFEALDIEGLQEQLLVALRSEMAAAFRGEAAAIAAHDRKLRSGLRAAVSNGSGRWCGNGVSPSLAADGALHSATSVARTCAEASTVGGSGGTFAGSEDGASSVLVEGDFCDAGHGASAAFAAALDPRLRRRSPGLATSPSSGVAVGDMFAGSELARAFLREASAQHRPVH
eukprot:TRINITY_DN21503_c0_g1_i1.p1 TRINITY_DN21503_c0_g1~~TRINITY_DN21503_c0_g1_i1.p1  ORF type:complete len:590 (+),score=161.07 TRINITY_DN21503_c0_g1_i1:107-1771(+)